MKKHLSLFSLFLLTIQAPLVGLTPQEVWEYEYQFIQKIIDSCSVVVKPPRVYTPEELFFLSEGRYCPDRADQAPHANFHERTFYVEVRADRNPYHDSACFKSPYAHDDVHEKIAWNLSDQTQPIQRCPVTSSSASAHQFFFTVQQKPTTAPSRSIQQQIDHARSSVMQRMQLFARMEQFNRADFLNFIFGTSFTDHTPDQELKDFIYDHTEQLLGNYALYPSTRYHQFLYHEVPGYRQHLQQVYDAMRSSHKAWHNIHPPGITEAWFKKHIEHMYDHFNKLPETDHRQRVQKRKFEKQLSTIVGNHTASKAQAQRLLADYHTILDELQDQDFVSDLQTLDRYQQRIVALEKTYNEPLKLSYNQYALSSPAEQLLTANKLSPADFTTCFGSSFAQQLHQELLCMLDQAAENQRLYNNQESVQWSNIIAQHADIACTYNKTGNIFQATQWTDTCWYLLDYAQAVGQGVLEGTIKGACFAAVATIAPVVHQAVLATTCAYVAGQALWTAAELANTYYDGGPPAVRKQLQHYKKSWKQYIDVIDQQIAASSGPHKVKVAAEFLTEVAVTPKILNLAKSIRTLELREIQGLLKKVKNKAKDLQVTDLLYKVTDPAPQSGYIQLPNSTKAISLPTTVVPLDHPSHITRKIIQYPWIATDLAPSVLKLQHESFILKEYAGNTPKKMKLYLMSAGRDEEIAAVVKQIDGKIYLPAQMQQALNLQYLTIDEQSIAHVASLEITHQLKVGTYCGGFHYDPGEKLRNSGILFFLPTINCDPVKKTIHLDAQLAKIGAASSIINFGENYRKKTLFPDHWSLQDILVKVQEALNNSSQIPVLDRGRYRIQAKTNCDITIQFVFDATGNLVTFFPI